MYQCALYRNVLSHNFFNPPQSQSQKNFHISQSVLFQDPVLFWAVESVMQTHLYRVGINSMPSSRFSLQFTSRCNYYKRAAPPSRPRQIAIRRQLKFCTATQFFPLRWIVVCEKCRVTSRSDFAELYNDDTGFCFGEHLYSSMNMVHTIGYWVHCMNWIERKRRHRYTCSHINWRESLQVETWLDCYIIRTVWHLQFTIMALKWIFHQTI